MKFHNPFKRFGQDGLFLDISLFVTVAILVALVLSFFVWSTTAYGVIGALPFLFIIFGRVIYAIMAGK